MKTTITIRIDHWNSDPIEGPLRASAYDLAARTGAPVGVVGSEGRDPHHIAQPPPQDLTLATFRALMARPTGKGSAYLYARSGEHLRGPLKWGGSARLAAALKVGGHYDYADQDEARAWANWVGSWAGTHGLQEPDLDTAIDGLSIEEALRRETAAYSETYRQRMAARLGW